MTGKKPLHKTAEDYKKSVAEAKRKVRRALADFAEKRKTLKANLVNNYTKVKYGTRLPTPPKHGITVRAKSIKLPTPPTHRVNRSPLDLETELGDIPMKKSPLDLEKDLANVSLKHRSPLDLEKELANVSLKHRSPLDLEKELADVSLKHRSPLDLEKELGNEKLGGKRTKRGGKSTRRYKRAK